METTLVREDATFTGDVIDPPFAASPQQTTLPSTFSAQNAECDDVIDTTLLVREEAAVPIEPPFVDEPHVTTLPSDLSAAKAV